MKTAIQKNWTSLERTSSEDDDPRTLSKCGSARPIPLPAATNEEIRYGEDDDDDSRNPTPRTTATFEELRYGRTTTIEETDAKKDDGDD